MPNHRSYLIFRGALYRLAYKELGGLLDEEETIRVNSLIKQLQRSAKQAHKLYPEAEAEFKKLRPILTKVNEALAQYLTDDEVAGFNKAKASAVSSSTLRVINTDSYLGRFKQINKLLSSKSDSELRDAFDALRQVSSELGEEDKVTQGSVGWYKALNSLLAKLTDLLRQLHQYQNSERPNEQAAYKKYVKLMGGQLPESFRQPIARLGKLVQALHALLTARLQLIGLYHKIEKNVEDKGKSSFTKYMRRDKEQREKESPGSEASPVLLTKKKVESPTSQQTTRANVIRTRKPIR